ncbi:M61 family metallopeptidase [Alteromonas facilis]|uniref:M61 family metallopeptidase n=1 Tax=Alteromonas facilis TaxID=2048004 RepID=UPI0013DC2359|nr:PDZ domain-containing protein [Alteromonas facilis]
MGNAPTIVYHLSPHSVSQHLFHVKLDITAHEQDQLTLTMPAWIPGSYMIRDFNKNLSMFTVKSAKGDPLPWHKEDKQTWTVHSDGQALTVEYLVYAFDYSVRSAYLNDEFGFINGTSAFLCVQEHASKPCTVHLSMGEKYQRLDWQVRTGMPAIENDSSGLGHYQADNYQTLIDYPILFGVLLEHTFKVGDIDIVMLFTGKLPLDVERIADDLVPILQQHVDLFNDKAPINKYWFMTLLAETGFGGLEHTNSTVLMYPRWDLPLVGEGAATDFQKTDSYRDFLALCSHEFLHTWHVKRTRPEVFIDYQLDKESYTNQLWIYEGFTSFYDDLALARAKAITPEQYTAMISKNITRLLRNPGRLKQSAADSSYDAWTRFYQQDANSINHIVSYYTKGGLIALCLDVYIREKSQGRYSMDDVMRTLWHEYGKHNKGTPDNVIHTIVSGLIGQPVDELLNQLVYEPGELPLSDVLNKIGLKLKITHAENFDDVGGKKAIQPMLNPLGINIKSSDTGVLVQQVREASNGCNAGLQVGDKLIAIDQWVVTPMNLARLLKQPNTQVSLTVIRDGRLLSLPCMLSSQAADTAYIEIADLERLEQWLGFN